MLTVESYGPNGAAAAVTPASRVLVRDANGHPVCVVVTWVDDDSGRAMTLAAHAAEPDFDQLLATFGTDRVKVRSVVHVDTDISAV